MDPGEVRNPHLIGLSDVQASRKKNDVQIQRFTVNATITLARASRARGVRDARIRDEPMRSGRNSFSMGNKTNGRRNPG